MVFRAVFGEYKGVFCSLSAFIACTALYAIMQHAMRLLQACYRVKYLVLCSCFDINLQFKTNFIDFSLVNCSFCGIYSLKSLANIYELIQPQTLRHKGIATIDQLFNCPKFSRSPDCTLVPSSLFIGPKIGYYRINRKNCV